MNTLRSGIFTLYFFVWTIFVLILCLPLLPFPPRVVMKSGRLWAKGVVLGAKWLMGITMEVRGVEHIPAGGCIVASKHQSAWETVVFYLLLDAPCYVLKKGLSQIPLFGWYTARIKTIAVDRKAGMKALKALVKDAGDRIADGRQVIIFPEGTRTKPGESRDYQPGIAAIYDHTKAVVLPVALNTGVCWPKNSFTKHPGVMVIEFLPALPGTLSRKELMRVLHEQIEGASAKLAAECRVS